VRGSSRWWLPITAVLIGVAIGIGAFTFVYAKGASYLTTNPAACANCHIMREHFAAWQKSSHHTVAGCSDCHMPHEFVGKYATKARNGFWHSFYFTTGNFPDPLRITDRNHEVTEHACRSCHAPMVEAVDHGGTSGSPSRDGKMSEPLSCTRCHPNVGHWIR
jgi:cytochrome c nitrite reductase small subunit